MAGIEWLCVIVAIMKMQVIGQKTQKIQYATHKDRWRCLYGYEPYWHKGDRQVFTPTTTQNMTLSNIKNVCGSICPDIYVKYGKVCGTWLSKERSTFENYCQLQNMDCYGKKGWRLLHKGPCREDFKRWKDTSDGPRMDVVASSIVDAYYAAVGRSTERP